MLVLTRKREEKITIGKNREIIITVLKIQGDKVSIGIEADTETPVYRSELLTRERKKDNDPICIENLQIEIEKEQELTHT